MGNCNSCHENRSVVSYIAFESALLRLERANRRLWVIVLLLVVLLFGSNAAWVYYESQFEDEVTTVTQEVDAADGGSATINDGVHINGAGKANGND